MKVLILFSLLFALDFYAFQAVKILSQNWLPAIRTIVFTIYWAVPLLAVGLFLIYWEGAVSFFNKNLFVIFRAIVFIAYLSKLPVVAILLIDDFRRLAMAAFEGLAGNQGFSYSRSNFMSNMAIMLGSLPFISLTYGIVRNRYRFKVFKEVISLKKLPEKLDGLRIVQISDIHAGSFSLKEPLNNAIDLINVQQADLVFFTGDLVNSIADEMDYFLDVFDKINAKYGVFSILGNHDYGDYVRWPNMETKRQNFEKLKAVHKQLGWDLLLNENRLLRIKDENIAIIGVENYSAKPQFQKYGDLEKAFKGAESASLKLLLSHDPTHWEAQVLNGYKDIDLTFSGHTHGFQFVIEIPGWVRWSPAQYVYKQWAGLYRQGEQFLYVNRGLGVLGYPGRVGILPEIAVIELKKEA